MRALAVHPDVLVVVSRVWQTTATLVRAPRRDGVEAAGDGLRVEQHERSGSGSATDVDTVAGASPGAEPTHHAREAFLIDSPVYPDELELTAQVAGRAGFAVAGLLATHGDWDHLLGRLAFPKAALGVAETTAARLTGHSGEAVRALRSFDREHYVARPGTLGLGELQTLPVPGRLEVGAGSEPGGSRAGDGARAELELHPASGHTADGLAVWVPWAKVLCCGDYLSPVEIPTWHEADGSRSGYRATLDLLRPLVERADWVVPGHGAPVDGRRALDLWREDVAYVERWTMPASRDDAVQRARHERNRAD